jgi:hypothetical protein
MNAEKESMWNERWWVKRGAQDQSNGGEWQWRQSECKDERKDCGLYWTLVSVSYSQEDSNLGQYLLTMTLLFQDTAPTGNAVDNPPGPILPAFRLMLPGPEPGIAFPDLALAVPDMIALPPEPHVPADGRQTAQNADWAIVMGTKSRIMVWNGSATSKLNLST